MNPTDRRQPSPHTMQINPRFDPAFPNERRPNRLTAERLREAATILDMVGGPVEVRIDGHTPRGTVVHGNLLSVSYGSLGQFTVLLDGGKGSTKLFVLAPDVTIHAVVNVGVGA